MALGISKPIYQISGAEAAPAAAQYYTPTPMEYSANPMKYSYLSPDEKYNLSYAPWQRGGYQPFQMVTQEDFDAQNAAAGYPTIAQQNEFAAQQSLIPVNNGSNLGSPIYQTQQTTPVAGKTPATSSPSAGGWWPESLGGSGVQTQQQTQQQTTTPQATQQAQGEGDVWYLRNIAQNAGYPTDATSAWKAAVDAQQYNLNRQYGNLAEAFNVSGGRFSSDFGTAAQDYWRQAALDQNAQLSQAVLASQENARARELQSAMQLGQLGYGAASQLFSQTAGNQSTAAQLMAQLGAQGAQSLLSGSITGAQGLFNAENNAALADVQNNLALQQLLGGYASSLGSLYNRNLLTGLQLGQSQYSNTQNDLTALYQEYLRTLPENSTLLPYLSQGATAYPSMYYPMYQQSQLPYAAAGLAQILAQLPGLLKS